MGEMLNRKRNQVRKYACLIFFSSIGYNLFGYEQVAKRIANIRLTICEAYPQIGKKLYGEESRRMMIRKKLLCIKHISALHCRLYSVW